MENWEKNAIMDVSNTITFEMVIFAVHIRTFEPTPSLLISPLGLLRQERKALELPGLPWNS